MPAPTIPSSPSEPILKPIIKHSASYAGSDPMFSRSSSTTTTEEGSSSPDFPQDIRTVRSSSSLPTRPPSPYLNVKFAPLPTIEPRKRKSSVKLGVAARSRMIRARRGQLPPDWADEEEQATRTQAPAPPGEDPFEVFGRYVVGKTKGLWRKVAPPAPSSTPLVVGEIDNIEDTSAESKIATIVVEDLPSPSPPPSPPPQPQVRHRAASEEPHTLTERHRTPAEPSSPSNIEVEGRVWEDEVGEEFRLQMRRVSSTSSHKEEKRTKRLSLTGSGKSSA